MKYSKSNLEKLELLFKELEYTVRYEKGNFNSGYCVVEHKKIVVVNRFYDIEGRINILLDILSTLSIDEASLTEKSQQFFRQVAKNQENQLKELLQVRDCFFWERALRRAFRFWAVHVPLAILQIPRTSAAVAAYWWRKVGAGY